MKDCGFNFDTTYTALPDPFFTEDRPAKVPAPTALLVNEGLARQMGLDFSGLAADAQAALFSGNDLPAAVEPFSQAYAGHQFGNFTFLGDGRAHVWGEHLAPSGSRYDIQFKGSGRTRYSRGGDGKAALGPVLREYIISEAMYELGIPTTRSLAVATTGEAVFRETALPGAILTRVAQSHIRVGTFQLAACLRDKTAVERLMEYTIERHYPELAQADNKALALLEAVMDRHIDLIVHWMRVGFIHGVMNTDNSTLSGETIDYGPCAFMDAFDPATVFSSIDEMGRYAYGNQPRIAQWNLARLAETLLSLMDDDSDRAVSLAETIINAFPARYADKWLTMMRAKLGLFGAEGEDKTLAEDLLAWMKAAHVDHTNTFRDLSQDGLPTGGPYDQQPFQDWGKRWQERIARNPDPIEDSVRLRQATNPAIIPRNHIVEGALTAATAQDLEPLHTLLAALKDPYTDRDRPADHLSLPNPGERVYQTFCGT